MKEESIFLDYMGDNPRMRVLQYLIEGRGLDYTLTDMLNAEVRLKALNSLIPKLLKLRIIIKTRKIGRATLYKINQDNMVVKQLVKLYDTLLYQETEKLFSKKIEMPV